jgi:nitrate reductase assembly molybdenum cofactor insertion protein NarJ
MAEPRLTEERAHRVCYQVASVLLGYPDDDLFGRLPELRAAVAELPPASARSWAWPS